MMSKAMQSSDVIDDDDNVQMMDFNTSAKL
jgi:hypothetical protein